MGTTPTLGLGDRFAPTLLGVLVLIGGPRSGGAQTVSGVVLSAADSRPVPYATIIVDQAQGRFADSVGRFVLSGRGSYRVRGQQIGFSSVDTVVSAGTGSIRIAMQPVVINTAAISVARKGKACMTPGLSEGTAQADLVALFDQLRENVERYEILFDQYPFRYRWEARRSIALHGVSDRQTDSTVGVDTTSYDSRDRHRYSVGSVLYEERSERGTPQLMMYLPTLRDLTDSVFLAAHCFAYSGEANHEMRIDFRPLDRIKTADVAGSVFLDATRYVVRRAAFSLTRREAVSSSIPSVMVTTTFTEEVPLVPILVAARTEEPLHGVSIAGLDPNHPVVVAQGTAGGTTPEGFPRSEMERLAVEEDRMLDHSFLGNSIGSRGVPSASEALPAPRLTLGAGCTMPASFETADVPIYATLAGAVPTDSRADNVLRGIRSLFHLPRDVALPVYGYGVGAKVTPGLTGQVAFTLDAAGRLVQVGVTASSLVSGIDSGMVAMVRGADAAHAFTGWRAGRYSLALSSAPPAAVSHSIVLARVFAAVMPLARAAALDPDSAQPRLPVNGQFEMVVDEGGRAIPSTLRAVTASTDAVTDAALAALRVLPALRFRPALAGSCPIKQVVMLAGQPAH